MRIKSIYIFLVCLFSVLFFTACQTTNETKKHNSEVNATITLNDTDVSSNVNLTIDEVEQPNFNFTKIEQCDKAIILLEDDGSVWIRGEQGSTIMGPINEFEPEHNNTSFYRLPDFNDIVDISASSNHILMLRSNGDVWGWGKNSCYQLGGTSGDIIVPIKIEGLRNIAKIEVSDFTSTAINENGELYLWGLYYYFDSNPDDVEDGEISYIKSPLRNPYISDVEDIFIMDYSMFVTIHSDSSINYFGGNEYLMDNIDERYSWAMQPKTIEEVANEFDTYINNDSFTNVKEVFFYNKILYYYLEDGSIATIVYNSNYHNNKKERVMLAENTLFSDISSVEIYDDAHYYLTEDDTLFAKTPDYVDLTDVNAKLDVSYPIEFSFESKVVSYSVGEDYVYVLTEDNSIFQREHEHYNSGLRTEEDIKAMTINEFIRIDIDLQDTNALNSNLLPTAVISPQKNYFFTNEMIDWNASLSYDSKDEIVDIEWTGNEPSFNEPGEYNVSLRVFDGTSWSETITKTIYVFDDMKVTSIASDGYTNYYLLDTGYIMANGFNNDGELGYLSDYNKNNIYNNDYTIIPNLRDIVQVAVSTAGSIALDSNGFVYEWGISSLYEDDIYPHQVEELSNITHITSGKYFLAAGDANGDLYAWSNHYFGSTVTFMDNVEYGSISTPSYIQTIGSGTFRDMYGNDDIIIIVDNAGNVWVAGDADYSDRLFMKEGLSESVDFIQILGLKDIHKVSYYNYEAYALDYTSTLRAWGEAGLGVDSGIWSSTYDAALEILHVEMPASVRKVEISDSAVLILLDDGTVWAAGNNHYGVLADQENDSYALVKTPIQIQSIEDIVDIYTIRNTFYAIDSIGNIYSWGMDWYDQNGIYYGYSSSYCNEVTKREISLIHQASN